MTDELGPRKPPITLRAWHGLLYRRRNHANPRYDSRDFQERWGGRRDLFAVPINQAMRQLWEEFPGSDGHA